MEAYGIILAQHLDPRWQALCAATSCMALVPAMRLSRLAQTHRLNRLSTSLSLLNGSLKPKLSIETLTPGTGSCACYSSTNMQSCASHEQIVQALERVVPKLSRK